MPSSFVPRLGGKSRIAKRLVKMFPDHKIYIEPFVGGGSVFLQMEPAQKSVINDLDKQIATAWKGMKRNSDAVRRMDFKPSKALWTKLKRSKPKTIVAQMYRTLYVFRNSFGGLGFNYADKGAKKSGSNLIRNLDDYKERLKGVTILNQDWKTVLKKYDSKDSFSFLDPPYDTPAGGKWPYKSMSAKELLPTLSKLKGKFLLTFESTAANKRLFKHAGYKVKNIITTYNVAPGKPGSKKAELVVMNY